MKDLGRYRASLTLKNIIVGDLKDIIIKVVVKDPNSVKNQTFLDFENRLLEYGKRLRLSIQ
jgi:hypothetical protein